jgi:hypothetical protein
MDNQADTRQLIEDLIKKVDEIIERLDRQPRYIRKHISRGKRPSRSPNRD